MPTQKAISANAYKNRGGTILYAGNIDTSSFNVTNAPGMTTIGFRSGMSGSNPPPVSSTSGCQKSVSSGNYGKMTAGKYVIMCVTDELAGVSNTVIFNSANAPIRKSIHKLTSQKVAFLRTWSWTGLHDGVLQFTKTVSKTTLSFGTDDAASPTRSIPGELVYMETGIVPTQADYSAKTGG